MNPLIMSLSLLLCSFSPLNGVSENGGRLDNRLIESLIGIKGEMNDESGVFTVISPRTNLKVSTAGINLTPPLGLASWVQFKFTLNCNWPPVVWMPVCVWATFPLSQSYSLTV